MTAGQNVELADGKGAFWGWNIYFELFGGGNPSYSSTQARDLSSFPHRDGLWLIQIAVGTTAKMELAHSGHIYARQLDAYVNRAIEASGMAKGGYSCYVDAELSENEWRQMYYGDAITRLENIKMQVDPHNLFRNPQSLGSKRQIEARRSAKPRSRAQRWSRL